MVCTNRVGTDLSDRNRCVFKHERGCICRREQCGGSAIDLTQHAVPRGGWNRRPRHTHLCGERAVGRSDIGRRWDIAPSCIHGTRWSRTKCGDRLHRVVRADERTDRCVVELKRAARSDRPDLRVRARTNRAEHLVTRRSDHRRPRHLHLVDECALARGCDRSCQLSPTRLSDALWPVALRHRRTEAIGVLHGRNRRRVVVDESRRACDGCDLFLHSTWRGAEHLEARRRSRRHPRQANLVGESAVGCNHRRWACRVSPTVVNHTVWRRAKRVCRTHGVVVGDRDLRRRVVKEKRASARDCSNLRVGCFARELSPCGVASRASDRAPRQIDFGGKRSVARRECGWPSSISPTSRRHTKA